MKNMLKGALSGMLISLFASITLAETETCYRVNEYSILTDFPYKMKLSYEHFLKSKFQFRARSDEFSYLRREKHLIDDSWPALFFSGNITSDHNHITVRESKYKGQNLYKCYNENSRLKIAPITYVGSRELRNNILYVTNESDNVRYYYDQSGENLVSIKFFNESYIPMFYFFDLEEDSITAWQPNPDKKPYSVVKWIRGTGFNYSVRDALEARDQTWFKGSKWINILYDSDNKRVMTTVEYQLGTAKTFLDEGYWELWWPMALYKKGKFVEWLFSPKEFREEVKNYKK